MRTEQHTTVPFRLLRWVMLQFRMHTVVEKQVILIKVDQQLLHDENDMLTLFANELEAERETKLQRSPCGKNLESFVMAITGFPGAREWVTVKSRIIGIGYEDDCNEAELSYWIKEALELLSPDGKTGPLKEVTVPITKTLRTE